MQGCSGRPRPCQSPSIQSCQITHQAEDKQEQNTVMPDYRYLTWRWTRGQIANAKPAEQFLCCKKSLMWCLVRRKVPQGEYTQLLRETQGLFFPLPPCLLQQLKIQNSIILLFQGQGEAQYSSPLAEFSRSKSHPLYSSSHGPWQIPERLRPSQLLYSF